MSTTEARTPITPRSQFDFGLDSSIPKHWLDNDAFRTRFFDGVTMTFPDGERYFISSVRAFKDQITDPKMQEDIKHFIWQEAQHGMVHSQYNQIMQSQGIPVDRMLKVVQAILQSRLKNHSANYNLAMTAAFEHYTAMMAELFFSKKGVLDNADPRMRSMLAWHAMEELEHKAVAFDVMQQVAKVGYVARCWAMVKAIALFNLHSWVMVWHLLRHDGFNKRQRLGMMLKGLPWVYGRKGVYTRLLPGLLSYFKPGFHPWHSPAMPSYQLWLNTFNHTGSAMSAGQALFAGPQAEPHTSL